MKVVLPNGEPQSPLATQGIFTPTFISAGSAGRVPSYDTAFLITAELFSGVTGVINWSYSVTQRTRSRNAIRIITDT